MSGGSKTTGPDLEGRGLQQRNGRAASAPFMREGRRRVGNTVHPRLMANGGSDGRVHGDAEPRSRVVEVAVSSRGSLFFPPLFAVPTEALFPFMLCGDSDGESE